LVNLSFSDTTGLVNSFSSTPKPTPLLINFQTFLISASPFLTINRTLTTSPSTTRQKSTQLN